MARRFCRCRRDGRVDQCRRRRQIAAHGIPLGTNGYGGNNEASGPAKAFDGDIANMYHSDQPDAFNSWVGLDLGEPKLITKMALFPRHEYEYGINGNNRFGTGVFQVANSPDFSDAQTFCQVSNAGWPNAWPNAFFYVYTCDRPGYGRYVRYLCPVDWLNAPEIEFSEGSAEGYDQPYRVDLWREPFMLNGAPHIPVCDYPAGYVLQYFDENAGAWTNLVSSETVLGENEFYVRSTNCTFHSGVVRWRYGYVSIVNSAPSSWLEFSVDTRNAVPLSDMEVYSHTAWDVFDPGIGKYGQTPEGSFDGNFYTTFHPNDISSASYTQDLCADLGSPKTIWAVTIAPHAGFRPGNSRMRYCRVEVSDTRDFEDPTVVYTMNDEESFGSEDFYVLEFAEHVTARYVRLVYGDAGWFNPAEMEVDLADPEDTSCHLTIEVADLSTYLPTLRFRKAYGEEGGVKICRSTSAEGPWELAGTVASGVGKWTESDSSMKYGRPYWYKVGSDIVEFRRLRKLSADPDATLFVDYNGAGGDLQPEGANGCDLDHGKLFDGDTGTYAFIISNTDPYYVNPAIGFDFGGRRARLALCRMYSSPSTSHSYGMSACGADAAQDVCANPAQLSCVPYDSGMSKSGWLDFHCRGDGTYRYLYIFQRGYPPLHGYAWAGSLREAEFYGWYDTDVAPAGFVVIVR
ncbi:MAG: hypothetical protein ILO34_07300 [Kiritimatiellae bacterium]|nr:hypothetical protein [Kiritimatiellia bacterium]